MRQIILASVSPRRRELMRHLGVKFKVVASNYREVHHAHMSPKQLVKFLAEGKAQAVAEDHPKAIVIGADTVVVYKGKVYGKPKNKGEAYAMLKELSGAGHSVFTGVALACGKLRESRVVETKVFFRKLDEMGIKKYIASGEPMDKAGAYAVQGFGAGLISRIEGDFTNVVGLPLDHLKEMLKKFL